MTQENLNNKEKKVERKPRKTTKTTKNTTRKATREITREKSENKTETKKRKNTKSIFKKSKLKIIPLGGLHEVGKNITVFEYEDEIIVVDCGLSFPEDDMLGVDLVIKKCRQNKRTNNNTWTRRPHRKCSIFIKTNKYTSICSKISNGINQKQIRRTQNFKKFNFN